MKFVLSVLTVLWVASATPSPLPAQVHAEPRTAPKLEERFRYEPTGLSLPRPYVREDAGRLRARAVGQPAVVAPDDRSPRGRPRDR